MLGDHYAQVISTGCGQGQTRCAEVDIIATSAAGSRGLATGLFQLPGAGTRSSFSEKVVAARRHDAQGCVLVLGAQQRGDARRRHQRSEERLHRLYGLGLSRPENLRSRQRRALRRASLGICAIRSDLRQCLDGDGAVWSKKGALEYRHCDFVPDYWAELPRGQSAERPRPVAERCAGNDVGFGGKVAVRTMSAAAKRDGVNIRTGHRVQRLIRNAAGEVIGVEADTGKGKKRLPRP